MATVKIERRPDPKAELGYVCPRCKEWFQVALWKDTEVYCEDCGHHGALRCPGCEEDIDQVFNHFEDAGLLLAREAKAAVNRQRVKDAELADLRKLARKGLLAAFMDKLGTAEWLEGNRESLGADADKVIRDAMADVMRARAEIEQFDQRNGKAA